MAHLFGSEVRSERNSSQSSEFFNDIGQKPSCPMGHFAKVADIAVATKLLTLGSSWNVEREWNMTAFADLLSIQRASNTLNLDTELSRALVNTARPADDLAPPR